MRESVGMTNDMLAQNCNSSTAGRMYLDQDGFWVDCWEEQDFVRTSLGVKAGHPLPDRS
jgi:hypothetical protein